MIPNFLKTFFLVFFILMSFYFADVKGKSVKRNEDKNQTRSFETVDEGFIAANKTDLCDPNPCKNNGTCMLQEYYMNASSDGFICSCADGYYGRYCQNFKNECENLTCVNNGVCIVIEKEVCICPLGFKGERCEERDKNESTCIWYFRLCEETGGYCSSDENHEFQCICPTGTRYLHRHGCLADRDIRNCSQDMRNCENTGGYCTTNRYQDILCKCPGNLKYESRYGCIVRDDAVNCSLYMSNCEETGGYCTRERYGTIQCKCPVNSTYELKYGCRKICYDGLCQNGGKCIVERGKFKCYCKGTFVGKFCETDPCRGNFCKNGGICRVDLGVGKCYCKEPYWGRYCEARMDTCVINICGNGGLCRTMNNTMKCFCMEPYGGKQCEKRIDRPKMTVTFAVACALGVLISSIVTSVICLCCHRNLKRKK